MKRIIDGKTYNTDTATLIHRWEGETFLPPSEEENDRPFEELYRTRHGQFFLKVNEADVSFDRDGYIDGAGWGQDIKPLTPAQAHSWLKTAGVTQEQIKQQFPHDPPDDLVAPESTESIVYLRLPDSLKRRLDTCAERKGQSLNTWVMRWLENAASVEEGGGGPAFNPGLTKAVDH